MRPWRRSSRRRARREGTVAAFDIGGLRGMVIGAHAELRSRGEAEPRLPEPPEADVPGRCDMPPRSPEASAELKPGSANRDLVERARPPSLTGRPIRPRRDGIAAHPQPGEAARRLPGGDRGGPRPVAEAGEGGLAYRHVAELLRSSPSASRPPRKARRDRLRGPAAPGRAAARADGDGAAYQARFSHLLVDEFQDTNRLQLRLIETLRGPQTQLMVVGDVLQSIYGFRHADLDVFRERREAIADPAARRCP